VPSTATIATRRTPVLHRRTTLRRRGAVGADADPPGTGPLEAPGTCAIRSRATVGVVGLARGGRSTGEGDGRLFTGLRSDDGGPDSAGGPERAPQPPWWSITSFEAISIAQRTHLPAGQNLCSPRERTRRSVPAATTGSPFGVTPTTFTKALSSRSAVHCTRSWRVLNAGWRGRR
jgi:hypothetical protein